jgi:hypothetical protein
MAHSLSSRPSPLRQQARQCRAAIVGAVEGFEADARWVPCAKRPGRPPQASSSASCTTAGGLPTAERYRANRYSTIAHGVGVCDEYPAVYYPEDVESTGYDGVLEAGMTICVESYIGEAGGAAGVKLEEQVLVTETGAEVLSRYPFEDDAFR